MPFTLKDYQQRALDALRDYFRACNQYGKASVAFIVQTQSPYREVAGLPGLPYVCLRLPTGGGKTVLACHAAGLACHELLHSERCLALWLVPSNTIREQTLKALRDRGHPYRQALDATLGAVTVLDVSEALSVQRATLDGESVIIVATMQAFRIQDTEGRKVYETSGALMSHFSGLPAEALGGLDKLEDGTVVKSLANVLRLRRPVVIVDEAHNARTPLMADTLERFRPACIIEFTATPDKLANPSNVLYSVSAVELYAEAMIKMPIKLETRADWKELLADAIARRNALEAAAKAEQQASGKYLRPIMLIQAQPHSKERDTLTVEVVKACLLQDHKIDEKEIAIATGALNELDDEEEPLSSPKSKVRYIITVQALREGWDCPFAYVLCSVAELRSSTAVEQILGRVMRLPNAERKQRPELNAAYAFAASANFAAAANALTDALIVNGFDRREAQDFVQPSQPEQGALSLWDARPPVTVAVGEAPRLDDLPANMAEKVTYDAARGELSFNGVMRDRERADLLACFATAEGQAAVEQLYRQTQAQPATAGASPAERGETLAVPVLAVRQADFFEVFEETHLLEAPWKLSEGEAGLSEAEYSTQRPEGQQGEIRLGAEGRLTAEFLGTLQEQMSLLETDRGWTVGELVHWLDRAIPHPDVTPTESGLFLTRLVRGLTEERGLTVEQLAHDKYRLKQAAANKIEAHRQQARQAAYQALLLPESPTPLTVTPELCFTFDPAIYPCKPYTGNYIFHKHYYRQVGDFENGEEEQCARFIDSLDAVTFWVRNLVRREPYSFWLQTSSDRFYPDFVAVLEDGRYLVVEYKGEDRWTNADSKEKRDLGGLWEARSEGRCLFVMARAGNFADIRLKIGQTTSS